MLPQNKHVFDYLNITAWHNAGYTGKGIKIGVLDSGYNHSQSHLTNITLTTNENADIKFTHAIRVMDIIRQILPDAEIVYGRSGWGLKSVLDHSVDLCTMSLWAGVPQGSMDYAMQKNVPLIKSAGNVDTKGVTNPGHRPEWISVAALSFNNGNPTILGYSSMGGEVEVAATTNMIATSYNGQQRTLTGTSGAAPVFAGMLGLLMSGMRRKLPINALRPIIYKYCKDIHVPGRDIHTGHGIFILPAPGSVR